jgi:hypothetical protein
VDVSPIIFSGSDNATVGTKTATELSGPFRDPNVLSVSSQVSRISLAK